ncbi:MAG TPA: uroporphyrinogen decarboxylase family protein [Armatimonadota bacterium]|jgi:uroporphyrinogen decarboxylase
MTSRERVLTALRRGVPDRVPHEIGAGLTPPKLREFKRRTGQTDPAAYFGVDVRPVGIGPTRQVLDHSGYHPDAGPGLWTDEWGVGYTRSESDADEFSHLARCRHSMERLESLAELEAYPLPDIEAGYRYEHLPGETAGIQARGLAAVGSMECTVWEIAWYMRGMERLMFDFVEFPEFAETLLDRILEKRLVQARRYAEAGVDVIRFGDDVASQHGMLMSLPMWRRWLKPRLAKAIAAAKSARPDVLIFYHTDGDATTVVPDLIEIGVEVLNPIQCECMDPAALKREYGRDIAFWGTVGTQSTLPFGTPDDVRAEVKTRMETVGQHGGLLLAPTHMVEPDVPWENLLAAVEAVDEYGWYR